MSRRAIIWGVDWTRARATDPERLLPGEASDSVSFDDARHWANVYRELVRFKEQLLAGVDREGQAITNRAPDLRRATELASLQAQYARLRRRLAFWETRERDLSAV